MWFVKKPEIVEAVQYHLREFADNPLIFEELPDWLEKAIKDGRIKPVFKSEDYWRLKMESEDGILFVEPGCWIVHYQNGKLYTFNDKKFNNLFDGIDDN